MNARNCQLCGRPLSRLRVGGDGDFCSKDHRNQFRLRAGMDRLVEVNKVASLMRRRESARQIPPASLVCRGITTRHSFGDLIPTRMDAEPHMMDLHPAAAAPPRVLADTGFCRPQASQAVPTALLTPRTHGGPIALVPGGGAPPRMLPRRHTVTAALLRHGVRSLPLQAPDVDGQAREFRQLPPQPVRTHLGDSPAALRGSVRAWMGRMPQAQNVTAAPAEGNALRVSSSLAFRVPPVRTPQCRVQVPTVHSLLPREQMRTVPGATQDCPAPVKVLDVAIPESAASMPSGPPAATASAFLPCAPAPPNGHFRDMPAPDPRLAEVRWQSAEPRLRPRAISQTASGFARRGRARAFSLPPRPYHAPPAPQLGASPFVVREDFCVPTVPYCNVLAAATPSDAPEEPATLAVPVLGPVAVPPAEAVRYEEHFDAGWDNWVGGVADWKVDIAGVRAGSLALYLPSLDLNDYDLEFLTRIDTRTVTWVVRAAGADSHLRCTVTAVEGGQLEFSRAVVQGGTAEAAVASSTRVPGKPRTTFTVRMSVAGPIFSLTINGKMIDSWVDDRLATGGIGFMGAADDQARLYWVRVSSPGAPSKEQTSL